MAGKDRKRVDLLAVVGEEVSTRDLVRFTGIVGLGFEANVTFLAVSPGSRQEFRSHTDLAADLLHEWEMETAAMKKLALVEEHLAEFRMVLAGPDGRPLTKAPLHRRKDGSLVRELLGLDGQVFRLLLREGKLEEEVVMETRERPYGMIFLGMPRSWRQIYRVLQFTEPPVMVVRKWEEKEYKFLVCFDGSPPSWRALRLASRIAKVLVAPLEVCAVTERGLPREEAEKVLAKAARYLEKAAVPSRACVEDGPFEKKVLEKADPSTILTMGTSRKSQVRQLLLGAAPLRLASRAPGPVLVVK